MKDEASNSSRHSVAYEAASPTSIQALFASIAPSYDKANSFASLGCHHAWNQRLIKSVAGAKYLLDLCAGTGEIALGFLESHPTSRATLIDFCPEMLQVAQHKGEKFSQRMELICADAMALPFQQACFDAVTLAYGIRNVLHPKICLQEIFRVLIPEGRLSILELTRPSLRPLGWLHRLYTRTCLPIFGHYVSHNAPAYRYLAKSVQAFVSPEELCNILQSCGFIEIQTQPLLLGAATLFTCKKPSC